MELAYSVTLDVSCPLIDLCDSNFPSCEHEVSKFVGLSQLQPSASHTQLLGERHWPALLGIGLFSQST